MTRVQLSDVVTEAIRHKCPYCSARPGFPCISQPGGTPLKWHHASRLTAARNVVHEPERLEAQRQRHLILARAAVQEWMHSGSIEQTATAIRNAEMEI